MPGGGPVRPAPGERDAAARRPGSRYRVVAVGRRGHGAGGRRPREVPRTAWVTDAVTAVDRLEPRRPVVVGRSPGGRTAVLTAAAGPERVRAGGAPGGAVVAGVPPYRRGGWCVQRVRRCTQRPPGRA
ncbi:alpha/beta fold hydrolase [Streptomyces sp. DH37]|uniref:alpha/beta fold hydrolase n=1 Tax=Streptomyces sp. DH37 TaxID=3040122 RepID=UPI002443309A|nr:alpha/beta fold hydrolase [Streptomyces sp. DH37]MDG9705427.1 alpha/beta fold hydrolase [Streptomyces sp. DH37]